MTILQLLPAESGSGGHSGEVFACAYSPDSSHVLSAGWDGHLRLWQAGTGRPAGVVCVGGKPLSTCALTPDGNQWLAGSLEGILSIWDPNTQSCVSTFLAHTRPLSSIRYTPDGKQLVTSSWDRNLAVWKVGIERDSHTLFGHKDIVAGSRITPDGSTVLSWSHDRTLMSWDLVRKQPLKMFTGHADRVTAGDISPDGSLAASGSRDQTVRLWNLLSGQSIGSVTVGGEVRGCFFLPDGLSLMVVDHIGHLTWHSVPGLEERAELITRLPVQCADLAPAGNQIAFGCEDGRVQFASVAGFEDNPLVVTPTQSKREMRTMLDRLFGRSRVIPAYSCTCPACGQSFELPSTSPGQPAPCPHCHRSLRLSSLMRVAAE